MVGFISTILVIAGLIWTLVYAIRGTGRDAIYLVNIGAKPFTLLYTDPRVNTEYMHIVEVGTSFILSTTHPYTVINAHNDTPAKYFSVNAYDNFSNTVRKFQHQW